MSPKPIAILASGMVTCVGFDAANSCAAIQCAMDNFQETRFMDQGGEWIVGAEVPLENNVRGRDKLLAMAEMSLRECIGAAPPSYTPGETALLVCLAEDDRPGRLKGLDKSFLDDLQSCIGTSFHRSSAFISQGRVGGMQALCQARELLGAMVVQHVLVVGVDSYLESKTLKAFENQFRLKTSECSDGFIPGEGAAALLLNMPSQNQNADGFLFMGVGFGLEQSHILSEQSLRADGMSKAVQGALAEAGFSLGHVDFRLTDLSGESYGFKEASLTISRNLKEVKPEFPIWTPADCMGETGAAVVPCLICIAMAAFQKDYAPGPRLICHVSNNGPERASAIFQFQRQGV